MVSSDDIVIVAPVNERYSSKPRQACPRRYLTQFLVTRRAVSGVHRRAKYHQRQHAGGGVEHDVSALRDDQARRRSTARREKSHHQVSTALNAWSLDQGYGVYK